MTTEVSARYDEVPYESHPYRHSHPRGLATVAQLFGMPTPSLDGARILEIGCASGGNLVPMAESVAASTCLGIDISARQIADGMGFVSSTGLNNVELKQVSILDLDESYGTFDYIICHGVFSWVERHVQEKILEVCANRLSSKGLAYISYNTYPGWHMKAMLRDMMKFHASRFKSPAKQIAQARALLNVLAKTIPSEDNPYGLLLKQESEKLRKYTDWYIYHEQLEVSNEPIQFHEFAQRAFDHGLQFLGEAELRTMLTNEFSPEIQAVLQEVGSNLVDAEQYMDFFRNRTFRQTILCHRDVTLNRRLNADSFTPFSFGSCLKPECDVTDATLSTPVTFKSPGWPTMTTKAPLLKAALLSLRDAWPEYLPWSEVEARARSRIGLPPADAQSSADFVDVLATWFTKGVVRMTLVRPLCTSKVSERPVASVVARTQAKLGKSKVCNLHHELVGLDGFDANVLSMLDGTVDRSGIIGAMQVAISKPPLAELGLSGDELAVGQKVDRTLSMFAETALLKA